MGRVWVVAWESWIGYGVLESRHSEERFGGMVVCTEGKGKVFDRWRRDCVWCVLNFGSSIRDSFDSSAFVD